MSVGDVWELPIYTFWELSKNIDRLRAEDDIRHFILFQNALGGGGSEYLDQLREQQGTVVDADRTEQFDKDSLNRLKMLLG